MQEVEEHKETKPTSGEVKTFLRVSRRPLAQASFPVLSLQIPTVGPASGPLRTNVGCGSDWKAGVFTTKGNC
jgi:hypothetical protein